MLTTLLPTRPGEASWEGGKRRNAGGIITGATLSLCCCHQDERDGEGMQLHQACWEAWTPWDAELSWKQSSGRPSAERTSQRRPQAAPHPHPTPPRVPCGPRAQHSGPRPTSGKQLPQTRPHWRGLARRRNPDTETGTTDDVTGPPRRGARLTAPRFLMTKHLTSSRQTDRQTISPSLPRLLAVRASAIPASAWLGPHLPGQRGVLFLTRSLENTLFSQQPLPQHQGTDGSDGPAWPKNTGDGQLPAEPHPPHTRSGSWLLPFGRNVAGSVSQRSVASGSAEVFSVSCDRSFKRSLSRTGSASSIEQHAPSPLSPPPRDPMAPSLSGVCSVRSLPPSSTDTLSPGIHSSTVLCTPVCRK